MAVSGMHGSVGWLGGDVMGTKGSGGITGVRDWDLPPPPRE